MGSSYFKCNFDLRGSFMQPPRKLASSSFAAHQKELYENEHAMTAVVSGMRKLPMHYMKHMLDHSF